MSPLVAWRACTTFISLTAFFTLLLGSSNVCGATYCSLRSRALLSNLDELWFLKFTGSLWIRFAVLPFMMHNLNQGRIIPLLGTHLSTPSFASTFLILHIHTFTYISSTDSQNTKYDESSRKETENKFNLNSLNSTFNSITFWLSRSLY